MELTLEEVLKRIDYGSFYQEHVPGFKANGRPEVLCKCPFHDDIRPSFSVNTDTGQYICHAGSCAKKGNAYNFLIDKYGYSPKDAIAELKKIAGVTDTSKPSKPSKKADKAPSRVAYLTLEQVKAIHQQLIREHLKAFQDKYGLATETVKKYLLGYQAEHYVIPMEIEPGKWALKEHKGSQSKGNKVTLYPGDVLKDGLPYIVIAEGEFKALLLNQMGFPAVSGTGGAGTWKKEWNARFTGLNVILAYDHDEAGRAGALRVAEALEGTAKSVKAVVWPSVMDGKDKKDVTDFFIALGKTKADFQQLIDTAREVEKTTKEIDGLKFREPESYEVREDRIYQTVYVKDEPVKKLIFHTALLITGRAIDLDTGFEDVEITFKRDHKWKRIWLPKRSISDIRKIMEFSDCGLPVNSSNAMRVIEYLGAFEACNFDLIKISVVVRGLGWKSIQDQRVFSLHKMVTQKDRGSKGTKDIPVEFVAEAGFERFVKALKPEGKYPEWRELVTEAIKYPYACFAFYASFAAPLLRMLKAPNFIIDFWGNTSCGKTTVLELASSVWGNPHKEAGGLIFSWDSTKVFLERMAHFFCDVPIFPDDSQTVDNRVLTSALYQIANGSGKGRGSITGIRHNLTWHTVCFSTGERPLTECTTFSGARARTISLYGSPFANAGGNFINDLKQGLREHYGHAGPKYIEGLIPLWDKEDETTRLKEEYKRYQRELSLSANSEVGDRYSHYFATVKLASVLVSRILGIGDPVEADETIFRVFNHLISESLGETDISTRSMDFIISWIHSSQAFFQVDDSPAKASGREIYGIWKTGEYVGIYPSKFSEVILSKGFSEKVILRGWAEKGWIARDAEHYTLPKRFIEGSTSKQARFVVIPWEVISKFRECLHLDTYRL